MEFCGDKIISERVFNFFKKEDSKTGYFVHTKKNIYYKEMGNEREDVFYKSINKIHFFGYLKNFRIYLSNEKDVLKFFDSEMKIIGMLKLEKGKIKKMTCFANFFAL